MANALEREWSYHDYTIACLCPMGVELAAVEAMLDHTHPNLPTQRNANSYTLGDIKGHNVVICVVPEIGTNAIAAVAHQLLNDFPGIRFGLSVGIGGGVPDEDEDEERGRGNDIRLGDIVVSQPTSTFGGVVQYDLVKVSNSAGFVRTGVLSSPPTLLLAALAVLSAQPSSVRRKISANLSIMYQRYPTMAKEYSYPGTAVDELFKQNYTHVSGKTCEHCEKGQTVKRIERRSTMPVIHYGTIASANIVVKNATIREQLRQQFNAMCVEMEAAGIMDCFPCLVIRGICDYADSHKNKKWQPYAAAVAAAYMKELLSVISPREMISMAPATNILQVRSELGPHSFSRFRTSNPMAENENEQSFKGSMNQDMKRHTIIGDEQQFAYGDVSGTAEVGEKIGSQLAIPIGFCINPTLRIDSSLFVGRKDEIRQMYEVLWLDGSRKNQRRLVLQGVGGVGKTQLAVAYAEVYHQAYETVFLIDATSESTLQAGYQSMARVVFQDPNREGFDSENVVIQMQRWLSDPGNTRWLLIFDSYNQPENYDIEIYYPRASHGAIIVTTRSAHRIIGRRLTVLPLQKIDQSLQILETRSGRHQVAHDVYAQRLAETLAGLPLALVSTGIHLRERPWSFQQYLHAYQQQHHMISQSPISLLQHNSQRVYETLELAYQYLEEKDSDAAQPLERLSSIQQNMEGVTTTLDGIHSVESAIGFPDIVPHVPVSNKQRNEKLQDLDSAIEMAITARDSTPENHPHHPGILYSLSGKFQSRYELIGELEDLNSAVSMCRKAVQLTPKDHADYPNLVCSLSGKLASRYELTGRLEDLDSALNMFKRALEFTPNHQSRNLGLLYSLSVKLRAHYELAGRKPDFDLVYNQALLLYPASDSSPSVQKQAAPTTEIPSDSGYASMQIGNLLKENMSGDDAGSIFSVTDSVTEATEMEDNTKLMLISMVTELICNELSRCYQISLQHELCDTKLLPILPKLLEDFAARLRHSLSSPDKRNLTERSAAAFVHINRFDIAKSIARTLSHHFNAEVDFEESSVQRDVGDLPTIEEKLEILWSKETTKFEIVGDDLVLPELHPSYNEAHQFIENSEALAYITDKIAACITLRQTSGLVPMAIRECIVDLCKRKSGSKSWAREQRATCRLVLDWDPVTFMVEQYDEPAYADFGDVITLTGDTNTIQAMTCEHYVHMIWSKVGDELLTALRRYIKQQCEKHQDVPEVCQVTSLLYFILVTKLTSSTVSLPGGTNISLSIVKFHLHVECTGLPHAIAEIAQILAWLGASCRANPRGDTIGLCVTKIRPTSPLDVRSPSVDLDINFVCEELATGSQEQSGTCWRDLFADPVVAYGYPIRDRCNEEQQYGLELPLPLLLQLGLVDTATIFRGGLLLDGFQTMFIPVAASKNSVQWHFIHSQKDKCISYIQADQICPHRLKICDLTSESLQDKRHFVGWTTRADIMIGSPLIDYTMLAQPSSLDVCSAGCVLEKATITGGMFVNAGVSFGRAKKDTPVSLETSQIYPVVVRTAANSHVVLCDVNSHRSWLVDGAGALLHITKAQLAGLEISEMDGSSYIPPIPCASEHSASETLRKRQNRSIIIDWSPEIVKEDDSNVTVKQRARLFQDLVLENFKMLNQILSYMATPTGLHIPTERRFLEGYDFADLVIRRGKSEPRQYRLNRNSRSWIDFTTSIGAAVLFGQDFGDLIVPAKESNVLCDRWTRMPPRCDYMATSLQHLVRSWQLPTTNHLIAANHPTAPLRLSHGIRWCRGQNLFESCSVCTKSDCCDRAQLLQGSIFGKPVGPAILEEHKGGAVIFGQRSSKKLTKSPRDRAATANETNSGPASDGPDGLISHDHTSDSGLGASLQTDMPVSISAPSMGSLAQISSSRESQGATEAQAYTNRQQQRDQPNMQHIEGRTKRAMTWRRLQNMLVPRRRKLGNM